MDRAKSLALVALLLAGCSRDRAIVVGSKNFTEQVILGEIVAQHLEHRLGRRVECKLNLGGTLLAHQALVSGQIDLYPEYSGTALTAVLKLPVDSDPAKVEERVRAEYRERWGIEWMAPLGFNNTFAMVIRGDDARSAGIATLSQAAQRGRPWVLATGYEFAQRPDGLSGLLKTYNLPLAGQPKTMDLGLLYKALEQKQVDMAAASATDGLLSARDFAVLRDDRGYFPPYHAALAVRSAALAAHAGLREALAELSGRFSDSAMRRMNYLVDGEHRDVKDVARDFLNEQRF